MTRNDDECQLSSETLLAIDRGIEEAAQHLSIICTRLWNWRTASPETFLRNIVQHPAQTACVRGEKLISKSRSQNFIIPTTGWSNLETGRNEGGRAMSIILLLQEQIQ